VNHDQRALAVKVMEITVVDKLVTASLRANGETEDQPYCNLDLSPRRKDLIDLLTELLRKAMDESRRDSLEGDLYRDLLQALGRELFDLLLRDNVATLVKDELKKVRNQEVRLRVNLLFQGTHAEWLSALPWEYIHTPHGDTSLGANGAFLSNETELTLSRRLSRSSRELGVDGRPIKVLLVCASPTMPEIVRDRDESGNTIRRTKDALRKVVPGEMLPTLLELRDEGFIGLTTLIDDDPPTPQFPKDGYVWKATAQAFLEKVKQEKPVLIHFMGHGRLIKRHGQLAFSKTNGEPEWIPDGWLADLASRHVGLKAVVLQACESAKSEPYHAFSGVAASLAASGVPAVIGMQYVVAANLATVFSRGMYRALARDLPVDLAVNAGREALSGDPQEWGEHCFGLPVLYLSQYKTIAQQISDLRAKTLSRAGSRSSNGDGVKTPTGRCPICGKPFNAGDRYGPNCGDPIPRHCLQCAFIFEGEPPEFCTNCGAPRAPVSEDKVLEPDEADATQSPALLAAYHGPGAGP
jgi:hypothetical protein